MKIKPLPLNIGPSDLTIKKTPTRVEISARNKILVPLNTENIVSIPFSM